MQFFDLGDARANDVCNGLVTGFLDALEKLDVGEADEAAILMAVGIVAGVVSKKCIESTAYEALDAITSIGHQTYDAAQIVKPQ